MNEIDELDEATPKRGGIRPLLVLVLSVVLGVLAFVVTPNFLRAKARGTLTSCKSNCKNIATALEMYASDHHGLYPGQLADLIPGNYFRSIPTCTAVGRDTYSATYQVAANGKAFSFCCQGNNHAKSYAAFPGSSENYPRYNSFTGLEDHP